MLEGFDEILTLASLGLPPELRRSLACTNIIGNLMRTVRRVCRNVKYWPSPSMATPWTGAAMQEAAKAPQANEGSYAATALEVGACPPQSQGGSIKRAPCPSLLRRCSLPIDDAHLPLFNIERGFPL